MLVAAVLLAPAEGVTGEHPAVSAALKLARWPATHLAIPASPPSSILTVSCLSLRGRTRRAFGTARAAGKYATGSDVHLANLQSALLRLDRSAMR